MNRPARTLFLMLMFMAGFAFVGFVVAPWFERGIEKMYLSGKKGAGLLGEIVIAVLFLAGLFYLYFEIYTNEAGIAAVLPNALKNKPADLMHFNLFGK